MLAILFDLDGTLLDVDIDVFMRRYFDALEEYSKEVFGSRAAAAMDGLWQATRAMMSDHPAETNQEAFYRVFLDVAGIDLREEWPIYQRFYEERFDGLKDGLGPAKGAEQAVTLAAELGLRIAIATNPLFPRIAIEKRLAWAGFPVPPGELVTTWENMRACKPSHAYYRQIADELSLDAAECLMVGDDPVLDLPAADVGMRTFHVSGTPHPSASHGGTLEDLARLLPRLAGDD